MSSASSPALLEVIEKAISGCRIMLVLITREWSAVKDARGRRLLDRKNDFVRIEIVQALKRGLVVVPILLGGAQAPAAEELPRSLARLTRRHALELRHQSWRDDVSKLVAFLRKALSPVSIA